MTKAERHGNGWTQHDHQRKRAFGLEPQDKWPDEGMGLIVIETSWGPVVHGVHPKGTGIHKDSSKLRRAFARCPTCSKEVCAGHLGQHMATHK